MVGWRLKTLERSSASFFSGIITTIIIIIIIIFLVFTIESTSLSCVPQGINFYL